jgi:hypothetical protein
MKILNIFILICLAPFANNLLAQPLACDPTADPVQICIGESSQLNANASGGSGSYTYSWTSIPPGFASDLASPVVNPNVTTTYSVSVSDGYDFVTGSVVLTVNTRPVPNAGPDINIPYGTYTTLQGSASSGSGSYSFHWEPASLLINPDVQNPETVNMTFTVMFSLQVVDAVTGCPGEFQDQTIVTITGGSLNVSPTANPSQICQGNSSQLSANALGGSGNYTYSWISDPPGFTSAEENPIVSPFETTIYTVEVNDGFNVVTSSVNVVIYSQLTVQASLDFQLCQNGQHYIKVQSTNAGREFTTIWYFQGNPVGNDSIYSVSWDEYGSYAPNIIAFTCVVTDGCGNTASDEVHCAFFPVVEIIGSPVICLYNEIQLFCSSAQSYQWYYDSYPGTPIPGATMQILNYTPSTPGLHTICVSILNDCGEYADTCYTFEVSELICDMTLNNSNDFSICSGTEFTLQELNAYGGWEWTWIDGGTSHSATGQTIGLELMDAGVHSVTVTAYNINGCWDTLTRIVNVIESPVSNAGPDQAIPYGTTTTLNGTVSGGSGNYNYFWEPADMLINPSAQNPTTLNLYQTTIFYLNVVDAISGCISKNDTLIVSLEGGPLGLVITIEEDTICHGESTTITAYGFGGNYSNYTYTWYDGTDLLKVETSPISSIEIAPYTIGYHVYTVKIFDGYNAFCLDITVYVAFVPFIDLGPDTTVCVHDSILLSAGNPGSSYYWSTGSTDMSIQAFSTDNEYEVQDIWVRVISPDGCEATDSCTIIFDIAACSSDTLIYFGQDSDTLYQYSNRGNCGYISGNNCDQDKVKANYFSDGLKTYNIEKVFLRFGVAAKSSLDEVQVKIGVWAKSDENDMPGDLIDFTTVPMSQIVQDVDAGSMTTAVFTPPVAVPKNFFVGVFLPQGAGDTLALMTDKDGESAAGIAWTMNAANEWLSYSSDPRFYLQVSNAIFPVVKQNNVGIKEPQNVSGEYLIYPNPAKDMLHIDSRTGNAPPAELLFYDMQGRVIIRKNFTSNLSLNLHGIDSGIYLLIIRQDNKVENHKVIVY